MKQPHRLCLIHHVQQANCTSGPRTAIPVGASQLPLDVTILPFSGRYDRRYCGGIAWWSWGSAPTSKKLPNHEISLPMARNDASKVGYEEPAIPSSDPTPSSRSLCRWWAADHCWWRCGIATWAQSLSETSRCWRFGYFQGNRQHPCCTWVVVRMKFTGMCVQGFPLRVGISLALWMVDGWVILWSCLERFWVSLWCVDYCIIKSVIFRHEWRCWEFILLGLIVKMLGFENGTVAEIGHHEWLSCDW